MYRDTCYDRKKNTNYSSIIVRLQLEEHTLCVRQKIPNQILPKPMFNIVIKYRLSIENNVRKWLKMYYVSNLAPINIFAIVTFVTFVTSDIILLNTLLQPLQTLKQCFKNCLKTFHHSSIRPSESTNSMRMYALHISIF